jgi:hypothetical protein
VRSYIVWQTRVTAVRGGGFANEARKMNITAMVARLRKVAVERMLEECNGTKLNQTRGLWSASIDALVRIHGAV